MSAIGRMLRRMIVQRELRRWQDRASVAPTARLSQLRNQVVQARRLRRALDRLIHQADSRLALPAIGTNAFDLPYDVEWCWRPELWVGPLNPAGLTVVEQGEELGSEVKLFHDCADPELILRQTRNLRDSDLSPFGLRMEVFAFDGSFLSLAVDLPVAPVKELRRRHLLRVSVSLELERPVPIYVRFNIKHGPNTEEMVEALPQQDGESIVEFDLAYTTINEKRIERAWVDLIFDDPAMNAMVLRDLTVSRRPRAEL